MAKREAVIGDPWCAIMTSSGYFGLAHMGHATPFRRIAKERADAERIIAFLDDDMKRGTGGLAEEIFRLAYFGMDNRYALP